MGNRNVVIAIAMGIATVTLGTTARGDEPRGATTVQLPTFGVAVDAAGLLSLKRFSDPGGRLLAARREAARQELAGDVLAASPLRKISLTRLETAVRRRSEQGLPPDDVMQNLAGLQRVRYVFLMPEQNDVVLAGPAEGFVRDLSERVIGVTTGRPTLRLDDLAVALRAFPPGTQHRPFVGCTINPDKEGLARLRAFQQRIPRSIPLSARARAAEHIRAGLRRSLGQADIQVFTVSDRTNMARVMLEADYRMKLIGIGLEPPPVKMITFVEALLQPRHFTLQQWWFTPDYECVTLSPDGRAMELVGQEVQLLGQDQLIGELGGLSEGGGRPSKANELFTTAFTKKYEQIARRSPVFAQLRQVIDLLIAAAFLRQQDAYALAGWDAGLFRDERAFPVETMAAPQRVDCAVNVLWKRNRLIAPAGGGVSIRPDRALDGEHHRIDESGGLARRHADLQRPEPETNWWWD